MVWILLSLFVVALLAYHGRTFWKIRAAVNKIPSPPEKPIIGFLLSFLIPLDEIWTLLRKLAAEYYPIYRYWQGHVPIVNVTSPEDFEVILSTMKHSRKSTVYDLLKPWLGNGLLISSGKYWQTRRKLLTQAFHFNILQEFIPTFSEKSQQMVAELQKECDKPFTNITAIVTQYTLLTICETAMGIELDASSAKWKEYLNSIQRMGELVVYVLCRPWFYVNLVFRMTAKSREMDKHVKILHSFSESIIERRKAAFKEPTSKRMAMLDLLLAAKNSGFPISDQGIHEEVDTFMFEGHDTTTACITCTLWLLACHPDIQEKVVEELHEVLGDSNHPPTYQELQNLTYLEMVIKESLRMYPSVPFISRFADEDLHTPSGYYIPKDTIVHLHIYDLHHNPRFYPDPEKFDPDRFLPENVQNRHPFTYVPFSAGPRNCIGQKFAVLEIKSIVSAVLRNFILEPVDTKTDVKIIVHLVLKTKNGIKIKLKRRV